MCLSLHRGYPNQVIVRDGGCPFFPMGDTPSFSMGGVPPSKIGWGYSLKRTGWGYSSVGTGWGAPCWDWMVVSPLGQDWMGVPPPPEMDGTWTGYATGSMPLLVSGRRTFLFDFLRFGDNDFNFFKDVHDLICFAGVKGWGIWVWLSNSWTADCTNWFSC